MPADGEVGTGGAVEVTKVVDGADGAEVAGGLTGVSLTTTPPNNFVSVW